MQSPPDLLHYLSNDVFRAVRTVTLHGKWKQQVTTRTPPHKVHGSSNLGIPGSPGHIIHAEWAPGVSEANPDLGIPRPYGIIVEREAYDSIHYEVSAEAWADWEAALTTDAERRTLWTPNRSKGTLYWRRNPNLPVQAASVGLKLTERLLEAGLIRQFTPAEHDRLRLLRGEARTPGMLEIIEEALIDAVG